MRYEEAAERLWALQRLAVETLRLREALEQTLKELRLGQDALGDAIADTEQMLNELDEKEGEEWKQ